MVIKHSEKDFEFPFLNENVLYSWDENIDLGPITYELPNGKWRILDRLSNISVEQAKSVVQQYAINKWHNYENNMPFYEFCTDNAIESLKSLVKSLNIKEDQDPVILVEYKN